MNLDIETNNDIFVEDSGVFSKIFAMIFFSLLTVLCFCLDIYFGLFWMLLNIIVIIVGIYSIIETNKIKERVNERKRRYEEGEMTPEEIEKYEEDYNNYQIKLERLKKQEEINKKIERDKKTIDYTIVVATDSKKSFTSGVVKGAIGGALVGPLGAAAGVRSAKNVNSTTFKIVYKSGRTELKTVKNNSSDFKELAKYVR